MRNLIRFKWIFFKWELVVYCFYISETKKSSAHVRCGHTYIPHRATIIHTFRGHDYTHISLHVAKSAPRRLSTRERRLPEEKSESSEKESVCARFRGPAPPACTPGFWVSSAETVKVKTWRGLVWMATACRFERKRGYYKGEPWILNLTIMP